MLLLCVGRPVIVRHHICHPPLCCCVVTAGPEPAGRQHGRHAAAGAADAGPGLEPAAAGSRHAWHEHGCHGHGHGWCRGAQAQQGCHRGPRQGGRQAADARQRRAAGARWDTGPGTPCGGFGAVACWQLGHTRISSSQAFVFSAHRTQCAPVSAVNSGSTLLSLCFAGMPCFAGMHNLVAGSAAAALLLQPARCMLHARPQDSSPPATECM